MTGIDYAPRVEACGARFVKMSEDAMLHAEDISQQTKASGLTEGRAFMRKLFIDRVPAQVRDYRAVLKTFKADILLEEFFTFGAHALRDLTGLPYATLGINPLTTADPEVPLYGSRRQPPRTMFGRWINMLQHALANWVRFGPLTPPVNSVRSKLGLGPLAQEIGFVELFHSRLLHIAMTTPAFNFLDSSSLRSNPLGRSYGRSMRQAIILRNGGTSCCSIRERRWYM